MHIRAAVYELCKTSSVKKFDRKSLIVFDDRCMLRILRISRRRINAPAHENPQSLGLFNSRILRQNATATHKIVITLE